MTFLPVVERELRVAARRRGTYWSRFVAAMIGAALAAWVLLADKDSEKEVGADLFIVASTVVFLYAAVAGTLVTCDCLSEEKREGTLGLLFLTDLKGHDVVLGKLAATSVNAFYGMLAVLPVLAVPFVLGGVSRAEMLRVVLVSLNLLFFFLSIGLFASALCRKDNWALGLAILIGLALLGGPAVFFYGPTNQALSSPAFGCFLAFDQSYIPTMLWTIPHSFFWLNALVTQLYAWIFFGLACRIVSRSWQDRAIGRRATWRRLAAPFQGARTRAALLEANPFLWRVARSGHKRLLVWVALGFVAVFWRWPSFNPWDPGMDLFLLVPAGLVLKAWLAAEASRTISEDRRSGAMELLLSTPLGERDIVRGQLLALWRQFALPVAALLLTNLMFLIVELRQCDSGSDRWGLFGVHLAVGGFLAADMIALSWVGIWLGLIQRKPNRAALLALTRIIVLPVAIFVGFIFLLPFAEMRGDDLLAETVISWIVIGLGIDLGFALAARSKLRAQFRTIVAEGVARKRPAQDTPAPAPALIEAQ
jgi:ABC-type transport system involved in cytochrome c biogenesis permease component